MTGKVAEELGLLFVHIIAPLVPLTSTRIMYQVLSWYILVNHTVKRPNGFSIFSR